MFRATELFNVTSTKLLELRVIVSRAEIPNEIMLADVSGPCSEAKERGKLAAEGVWEGVFEEEWDVEGVCIRGAKNWRQEHEFADDESQKIKGAHTEETLVLGVESVG